LVLLKVLTNVSVEFLPTEKSLSALLTGVNLNFYHHSLTLLVVYLRYSVTKNIVLDAVEYYIEEVVACLL